VVTTTTDHGYVSGLLVRIVFPVGSSFGMTQLNTDGIYIIRAISTTQFQLLGLDTTGYDPFVLGANTQSPQVIPVATYFPQAPPISLEATRNERNIIPEVSWTNTTFPWINSNSLVRR